MTRLWIFLFLVSVFSSTLGQNQYHREIKPRRGRPQRQILFGGNALPPNEQNAAAALNDATQNAQAAQLGAQYLSSVYTQPQQQIQYVQPAGQTQQQVYNSQSVIPQTQNGIVFIDQYGQLVQVSQNSVSASAPQPQPQQPLRYVDQYGNDIQLGGQPALGEVIDSAQPVTQVVQQTVVQPQPVFHQVLTPQVPVYHQQVIQPQPVLQQVEIPQPIYHHIAAPAPVVQKQLVHAPAPVFHQVALPAPQVVHQETFVQAPHPVQFLHPQPVQQLIAHPPPVQQLVAHPQPVQQLIAHPQPVQHIIAQPHFHEVIQPLAPVVKKLAVPVVQKTIVQPTIALKAAPAVNIIKQPVHTKPVFQKQIFALKNPPVRVLTYSDLCTVYPYQRKLPGCVLKKASIPELHHPDIQLVSDQTINQPSQRPNPNPGGRITSSRPQQITNTNSNSQAGNIQDILGKDKEMKKEGSVLPLDQNDENPPATDSNEDNVSENNEQQDKDNDDNFNLGESSNKKENQVAIAGSKSKLKLTTKGSTTTTTTTTTTTESTTTTKKPKSKRRASSSKRRSQRRKNSSTTSTEAPFELH